MFQERMVDREILVQGVTLELPVHQEIRASKDLLDQLALKDLKVILEPKVIQDSLALLDNRVLLALQATLAYLDHLVAQVLKEQQVLSDIST